MTFKEDFNLLCSMLQKIKPHVNRIKDEDFPPVFSFEGLPGSGKTTQISIVAKRFEAHFGKACYIDIPISSGIGSVLKLLYADQKKWPEVSCSVPWLNPLFVSLDLQQSLINSKKEGARYALMSRGLLSTYYYNLKAFTQNGLSFTEAWEELSNILKGFVRPKAIIFLDLPVDVARQRVVSRNRLPLRKMDEEDSMLEDLQRLREYIALLEPPVNVYKINADQSEEQVAVAIGEVLAGYLDTNHV